MISSRLKGCVPLGIGVDVVSLRRIEQFLARHPFESLKRLLAPPEQLVYQSSKSPVHFFARCFAAKEAYFKACGGTGMGEAGLREIETVIEGNDQFRIVAEGVHTEGSFFEIPEGVGARVLAWRLGDL